MKKTLIWNSFFFIWEKINIFGKNIFLGREKFDLRMILILLRLSIYIYMYGHKNTLLFFFLEKNRVLEDLRQTNNFLRKKKCFSKQII